MDVRYSSAPSLLPCLDHVLPVEDDDMYDQFANGQVRTKIAPHRAGSHEGENDDVELVIIGGTLTIHS